ncbi:MAG: gliding motility-associated C-terminal domain-containing protein [Bacteroidia bacterium]|nr:gliding motility-associated C-terminal domain-containing protein [Bacteroidia bacterium]
MTSLTDGTRWMTQGFHQPVRVNDSIPYSDTSAFIPNGITPNSDGFNDSWVIDGIDTVRNTVYVFNRWGDLVWKASDYDNASVVWKGDNFNGDRLPVATYFYIISTPQKEFKGWIELLR